MYVVAWASREQEAGRTYSGQDVTQHAPETSDEARLQAAAYIGQFEAANRMSIEAIYAQACKADGVDHEELCQIFREDRAEEFPGMSGHPAEFGRCLGHMGLGTGVSWGDDHEKFELYDGMERRALNVPHTEFHLEDALAPLPKLRGPEGPTHGHTR